ncbi:MAG: beta-N-acetylglucosaminidase domain-containing protein [Gammaproteobacteria bacterium]|nr:beta-N-acetylglucosaminidase domain-containing protein [Gammaproteobacteria bacterium]
MRQLPFGLGLVEGFYGRQWRDEDRIACLRFIAGTGYRYYLYAPKGDAVLRRRWSERWDTAGERGMRAIAECCAEAGLDWGFGLSPLGLVEDPSPLNLRRLRDKVRYLESFGARMQCVLFDDMPRNVHALAAAQLDIFAEVMSVSEAGHALVCPSYYSTDPVLERVFGAMPADYWEELGAGLPRETGIFWTGDRVCAESHDAAGLGEIAARFARKPVLWDNYPVNDGARGSNFLRIDAFRGRGSELAEPTQAHCVNPMNQCWLSRIALQSLALLYQQGPAYDADAAFAYCLRAQCEEALAAQLAADLDALQREGLSALSGARLAQMRARYAEFHSPLAEEIRDWLHGGYAFDPACLTD